ncbi:MAG: FISUMP domain-containing protein [Bacteroides sp.]|jgi:uncharacterized protein (TIGR02145 family)|nr:FISUMP domain-containing protein [Bacteroides sp.]
MKEKVQEKRAFGRIALFISAVMLTALTFHSCQKDLEMMNVEEIGLKNGAVSEINLDYPEAVTAGEDFTITFSSTCGRIMLERGFTAEVDELGVITNKVYKGLTCNMPNLMWEPAVEDIFEDCGGATITQNLAEPGTYVYRAKLNFKAKNNSGCVDCGDFLGNQYECFTVIAGNENLGTFTDARDGKVYMWVKIGEQIWMAENLAYNLEGSYITENPNDTEICGRYYNWEQAQTVAPEGWHLPSKAEWFELMHYLYDNGYYCGTVSTAVAKSIALPGVWNNSAVASAPGNPDDGCNYNSTGFSAFPAGFYGFYGEYSLTYFGQWASFWSSNSANYDPSFAEYIGLSYDFDGIIPGNTLKTFYMTVRCVKDAE